MNIRKILGLLALLSTAAFADSGDKPVHAVMFEMTLNTVTHVVTHAQVVGGYPDLKECNESAPKVMVLATRELKPNEVAQLQCFASISLDKEAPAPEPVKPDATT